MGFSLGTAPVRKLKKKKKDKIEECRKVRKRFLWKLLEKQGRFNFDNVQLTASEH